MTVNASLTRVEHAKARAHLRALRTSLTQARDALMHFNGDHLDLDKLEPAARRVDDLMNLFAGEVRDSAQGPVWNADDASLAEHLDQFRKAARVRTLKKKPGRSSANSRASLLVAEARSKSSF
jgi:hypothetical protein